MINFKSFYKKRFAGQIFVVKAGGRIIEDDTARLSLLKNIHELTNDGIKVLLIYGGGAAIDAAIQSEKREPTKIDGRRITSEADIACVKKVLAGDFAFRILENMAKLDLDGYVFNTVPDHWALYKRRPKKNDITRFDATIEKVHTKFPRKMFETTRLIIVPCLSLLKQGVTVNINADNMAVALASGMKAAKLIFLTDVDGVKIDDTVQSVLTPADIEQMINDKTVIGGMQVKLENCVDALRAGVKRVHILNGFKKDMLRNEVYTKAGTGTMIVRQAEKTKYDKELKTEK
ncbi:MAG: acetylglutamate kinase [Pseudomonadota bacterium]